MINRITIPLPSKDMKGLKKGTTQVNIPKSFIKDFPPNQKLGYSRARFVDELDEQAYSEFDYEGTVYHDDGSLGILVGDLITRGVSKQMPKQKQPT